MDGRHHSSYTVWEVETEERQNIWGTEVLELHSSNPNNREHALLVSDHQTELFTLRVTQDGASSPYTSHTHTHTEMFLADSKSFRLFIGNTEKQIDGEIFLFLNETSFTRLYVHEAPSI